MKEVTQQAIHEAKAPSVAANLAAPAGHAGTVILIERPAETTETGLHWNNAGMLTFYGVLVTLLVKWISDGIQRRYELRRQLYLDLIEALQLQSACIGQMCDINIPMMETQQKFQKTGPTIAKVELVAPEKLSVLLGDYKSISGRAMLKLMQMRAPIEKLKIELSGADTIIESFKRERDILGDELRRLAIEGSQDQARINRVDVHYRYYFAEIQKQLDAKTAYMESLSHLANQMTDVSVEAIVSLASTNPLLLKYGRKELGYWRFNLRRQRQRTAETTDMVRKAVAEVRESLKTTANQRKEFEGKSNSD